MRATIKYHKYKYDPKTRPVRAVNAAQAEAIASLCKKGRTGWGKCQLSPLWEILAGFGVGVSLETLAREARHELRAQARLLCKLYGIPIMTQRPEWFAAEFPQKVEEGDYFIVPRHTCLKIGKNCGRALLPQSDKLI